MKKIIHILLLLCILITLQLFFVFNGVNFVQPDTSTTISQSTNSETSSISSKLSQKITTTEYQKQLSVEINNAITNYNITSSQLSINYKVAKTEYKYFLNPKLRYFAASTLKVPVAMFTYDLINTGKLDANSKFASSPSTYEEGSGIIQNDPIGTSYTLQTLLNYSIVYSDNIAFNILWQQVLAEFPFETIIKKAMPSYDLNTNTINSDDLIVTLDQIYNNKNYTTLINDMKHIDDRLRIPSAIPPEIEVANKIGTWSATLHDFAIVYTPQPYELAISCNDCTVDDFSKISETIFNFHQKNYKNID